MNQPDDQTPRDPSPPPFVRPAATPPARESQDDLPEPLAPFFGSLQEIELGGEAESAAPELPADPAAAAPTQRSHFEAADDSSWLTRDQREDADQAPPSSAPPELPSYLGGVPEVDLDAEPEIISFDDLSPSADTAAEAAGQPAGAEAPDEGRWHSAFAPPEHSPTRIQGRELHVEQAGGFREAGSVLAQEVASRLERIARSLRSHSPAELLAGTGDPLEVLIIGYVLGASRGSGDTAGDQASEL